MPYYVVVYAIINSSAQVEYNYYRADCGFTPVGLRMPYRIKVKPRTGL